MIYLIGTRYSSESTGTQIVIYGCATNDVDALIVFDRMKKEVVIDEREESYELWEVEENKFLGNNWIG